MTLNTILTYSRAQAQTDNNGLTDTNGVIFANEALQDFHRKLTAAGVDASQIQESFTNGTANQGTYLYPTDMLFLKAIEVNFTDTNTQNYLIAEQIDVSNTPNHQSFSWLRANQSVQFPKFDDHGDWFEIFPTPIGSNNLTNMFRIFYFLQPTQYSTTSDNVSYPENLDTSILGWRIAASYYYSLNKMEEGDMFNNKYEERVKQYVATLGRGVQTPMQATVIQDTGWQY